MRALIACESSKIVRDAFARRGWAAYCCDLLAGADLVGDVRKFLCDDWDLMIAHPPCTFLCSSGLHWNGRGRGYEETERALDFVCRLMCAPINFIAIENPTGCIGTRIRPADQFIQPYEFGEDASKKTGLWLKNLPKLSLGRRVAGRVVEWPAGSGKFVERWSNQTNSGQNKLPPSENRWQLRSETYLGIAEAMAEQWTHFYLFGSKPDSATDSKNKPLAQSSAQAVGRVVAGARIELATQGFSVQSDPNPPNPTVLKPVDSQVVVPNDEIQEHDEKTKT